MLRIEDLRVTFRSDKGTKEAVRGVSLSIGQGEWVCLVGESGSGKSMTALSLTRLNPPAQVTGRILWMEEGVPAEDLLTIPDAKLRKMRGKQISYVFQDPHTSFNPVRTIGEQMVEAYRAHYRCKEEEAVRSALASLAEAHLPEPRRMFESYPHELSGGMKQRIMIAMALQTGPRLLVADEPTTALDVTVERAMVDLLKDIRTEWPFAMLYITHNLRIAQDLADRIYVMQEGRIVEELSDKKDGFRPKHPYSKALFSATMSGLPPRTEIPLV